MKDTIKVIYRVMPFESEVNSRNFDVGVSIGEIAIELQASEVQVIKAWCSSKGDLPADSWSVYKPLPGETVLLILIPQKKLLAKVLPIALPFLIPGFGAFLSKSPLISKTLGKFLATFLGALLINSLIKPPSVPPTPAGEVGEEIYSVGGTRNVINPNSPIPYLIGKRRIAPPYAAQPFTLNNGNDQILHALFVVSGYDDPSDINLSDFRIGQVSIDSYPNTLIKYDKPYSLWSKAEKDDWYPTILQEDKNVPVDKLDSNSDPVEVIVVTEPDSTGFDLDFSFPQGLYVSNNNGTYSNAAVDFKVSYRPKLQLGETTVIDWLVLPSDSSHTSAAFSSPSTLASDIRTIQWNGSDWAVGDSGQIYAYNTTNNSWGSSFSYKVKANMLYVNQGYDGSLNRYQTQGVVGFIDIGTFNVSLTDTTGSTTIPLLPNSEIANPPWVDSYTTESSHGLIVGTTAGNFYRLVLRSDALFVLTLVWEPLVVQLAEARWYPLDLTWKMCACLTPFNFKATSLSTEIVGGELLSLGFVREHTSSAFAAVEVFLNTTMQQIVDATPSYQPDVTRFSFPVSSYFPATVKKAFANEDGFMLVLFDDTASQVVLLQKVLSHPLYIASESGPFPINIESRGLAKLTDTSQELHILEDRNINALGFKLLARESSTVYSIEPNALANNWVRSKVSTIPLIDSAPSGLYYDKLGETILFNGAAVYAIDSATAGVQTINDKSIGTLRIGRSIKHLRSSQWEIKIERLSSDNLTNTRIQDRFFLENVKSRVEGDVIAPDVKAFTIALQVKATDQLNGALDDFNCIASRRVLIRTERSLLACLDKTANKVTFVDVTEVKNSYVAGVFLPSFAITNIYLDETGGTLYLAHSAGVRAIDISDLDLNSYTVLDDISIAGATDMVGGIDSTMLFVRAGQDVVLLDTTDPANISVVHTLTSVGPDFRSFTFFKGSSNLYVLRDSITFTGTANVRCHVYKFLSLGAPSQITSAVVDTYSKSGPVRPSAIEVFITPTGQELACFGMTHTDGTARLVAANFTGNTLTPVIPSPPIDMDSLYDISSVTHLGKFDFEGNFQLLVSLSSVSEAVFSRALATVTIKLDGEVISVSPPTSHITKGENVSGSFKSKEGYIISTIINHSSPTDSLIYFASPADTSSYPQVSSLTLPGVLVDITSLSKSLFTSWGKSETSDPAWYYVDIMTGYAAKTKLDKEEHFNVPRLEEFAKENVRLGYEVNQYITKHTTPRQLLETVLATSRASWGMRDGLYTIITDGIKLIPQGFYSPRNMIKGSFVRNLTFIELPHALKVTFFDEANDWQKSVRVVYDDGYSLTGKESDKSRATRFEDMSFIGVTNASQIESLSRYHLAQVRLRPYTDSFSINIEFLNISRGDLICYQHDSVLLGTGDGRLSAFTSSGLNIATITIDDSVLSILADTYKAQLILWDGTVLNLEVQPIGVDGYNNQFTVTNSVPVTGLERGMRLLFWDYNVGVNYGVVTAIAPNADLTASIEVQPYNSAIPLAAEGHAIPAYSPTALIDPDIKKGKPAPPEIRVVTTDESALFRSIEGTLKPRIVVGVSVGPRRNRSNRLSSGGVEAAMLQARAKLVSDTQNNWVYSRVESARSTNLSIEDIEVGETYIIEAKSIAASGEVSQWTIFDSEKDGLHTEVLVIGNSSPPLDLENFTTDIPVSDNTFRFHWDAPIIPDFANAELRQTMSEEAWEDANFLARSKTTQSRISFLGPGERWVYVKSIDTAKNESENASIHKMNIESPEAVNLTGRAVGNVAVLSFDNLSGSNFNIATEVTNYYLPIREYEIYRGPTFISASIVSIVNTHSVAIEELVSGDFTYWVVAVDVAGNRQQVSVSVGVTVGNNPSVMYLTTFTDYGFLNPSDSLNYLVQEDGDVLIPFDSALTWADNYAPTEIWDTSVLAGFEYLGQTEATTGFYETEFDYGEVIASANLSLRYSYDSLGGNPDIIPTMFYKEEAADPWISGGEGFTGVLATDFRYIRVRIEVRVSVAGGYVNFKDRNIEVDVAAQRFEEQQEVQAVAGDVGGTRINYIASFVAADTPQLTFIGVGPYTLAADNADRYGFDLYVYDSDTGTRASTTLGTSSVKYTVSGIL